jgi:Ca2+-binding RTX toxin-like protein
MEIMTGYADYAMAIVIASILVASPIAMQSAFAGTTACTTGTEENDHFAGGDGDQCFIGRLGNDTIAMGDGEDAAFPGPGRDKVAMGNGDDYVYVFNDGDRDSITCGEGNDTIGGEHDPLDKVKSCENDFRTGLPQ